MGSNLALTDPKRDTARFWNANAINQLNKTLQDFVTQNHMDLLDTARLLAMGNMVPTDAGMACFDSKYTYRAWRPITAIRNANIDGNPATSADPTWAPLTSAGRSGVSHPIKGSTPIRVGHEKIQACLRFAVSP